MATLDSDFIRLHLDIGTVNIICRSVGLEWPPPERLYMTEKGEIREASPQDDETSVLICQRRSQLPDDVANHPNIARGAEYRYLEE